MWSLAAIKLAARTRKFWLYIGGILLVLGMVAGSYVATYRAGVSHCQAEQAQKETKEAKKETAAIKKEVEVRTPIVEKAVKGTTELKAKVEKGKEKLDAAIEKKGPSAASCDLTDDELRAFNELETKND